MEKNERLRRALDYLINTKVVYNQEDTASKLGCNKTTLSNALNGNPKYITSRFLMRFCRRFEQISFVWLDTGAGAMLSNTKNTDNTNDVSHPMIADTVVAAPKTDVTVHDMLVKSTTTLESMKAIVETVGDPSLAIELIGKILGVTPKKDDTRTTD